MNRKSLLNKFLANECSAEEAKLVFTWLNDDPTLLDDLISEDDWVSYINQENKSKRGGDSLLRIITVFVLFGFLFVLSNLLSISTDKPLQTASFIQEIYYNPSAQPKEIIAADNSILTLEPGALIQLVIKPDLDFRRVKLFSGRVNFKVAKDPSKPFIVESGTLMTTALGTEFIVDYNAAVEHVLIRLFEGKVRVESIEPSVVETNILKPGQQIYFGGANKMLVSNFKGTPKMSARESLPAQRMLSATEKPYRNPATIHQSANWLQLEETAVSDIIQYINHELDVPISYDSLIVKNYRIKGRFSKNPTMDLKDKTDLAASILQLIVEVNPFILEKQHNTYILKPKK
jgi:hypothetical protein